jgi:HK97 family phage prohead protease
MSLVHKTAAGKQSGSLSYVLSDATVDRYGDVIEPRGWRLDWFRQNPVALFNHNANAPIGNWRDIRVEDDRLVAELQPAPAGTTQLADDVRRLIDAGVLNATSVGFRGINSEPIDPKHPHRGTRYVEQELLETSIVSVPANPAALQIARSLNISDDTMTLAFGGQAVMRQRSMVKPGGQAVMKPLVRGIPMNISQQIEDVQAKLNAARDALLEHTRSPDYAVDEASDLQDEIDTHETRLVSLQRTERALATRIAQQSQPMPAVVTRRPFDIPTTAVKPVDLYIRAMGIHLLAAARRQPVEDVLRDRYPDDEGTAILTRAAIAGATTTTSGWASELVQLAQGEFVNLLFPNAVFPKLSAAGTALPFGPNAGAIKIPSRATTPSIGGSFVAEGAPIPVRRLGTTSITLNPHKVGTISVHSREIAAYSNPQIDGLIRDAIVNDTQINVDSILLDAVAVSTTRPAGLTNGVTPVTASTAHGYTAILADLQGLSTPFYVANAGRKLVLIMSPVQLQQLSFAAGPSGVPFGWTDQFTNMFTLISSATVTPGSVYMVDAVDFVSVSGAPEFEVSEVATLHMEDTTPLNIASGAQGSGVLATPTQSMFQTGQVAIRMLANVSWAMRRPGMVQFMTGVNWGP